jgi:hypothetical protein
LNDLIDLDVHFDRDWWNADVFEPGLEPDLKLAASLLGEKNPAYQHLEVYAKLARQEEKKAGDIRSALSAAGLVIGAGAVLPKNSQLARAICELAVGSEAITAKAVWDAHAAKLRERLATRDRDALHLLGWLAVETKNGELAELDRLGWKEWKDPEFAVSYVIGLADQKKITTPDDKELLAALEALPENGNLCSLRVQLAGEKGASKELIVAAIKGEFRKLSVGMAIPDSYRLKGLFYALKEKL